MHVTMPVCPCLFFTCAPTNAALKRIDACPFFNFALDDEEELERDFPSLGTPVFKKIASRVIATLAIADAGVQWAYRLDNAMAPGYLYP